MVAEEVFVNWYNLNPVGIKPATINVKKYVIFKVFYKTIRSRSRSWNKYFRLHNTAVNDDICCHCYLLFTDWIQAKDELISKLNKEKKHIQEVNSKAVEELAAADEKVAHLAMVKNKLEQTLDDLEVRSTLY